LTSELSFTPVTAGSIDEMVDYEKTSQMSNDAEWTRNLPPGYHPETLVRVQKTLLEMMKEIDEIFRGNNIQYFIGWGTLLGAVRHGGFIPWDDDLDICVFDEEYEKAISLLRDLLPKSRIVHDKLNDDIYWCDFSKIRDLNSETISVEWPEDNKLKYLGVCVDVYRAKQTTKIKFIADRARNKAGTHWQKVKPKKKPLWKKLIRLLLAGGYWIEYSCLIFLSPLFKRVEKNKRYRIIGPFYRYKDIFREDIISPIKDIKFDVLLLRAPSDPHRMLRALYGNYLQIPSVEKQKGHYSRANFVRDY
jgi:lipopolysaccharide cholinephosphotransferase